jgi:hypothetical protein
MYAKLPRDFERCALQLTYSPLLTGIAGPAILHPIFNYLSTNFLYKLTHYPLVSAVLTGQQAVL